MGLSNLSTQSILKGLFLSITIFTVLIILFKTSNLKIETFDTNYLFSLKQSDSFLMRLFSNLNQDDNDISKNEITISINTSKSNNYIQTNLTKNRSLFECSYKVPNKTSKRI